MRLIYTLLFYLGTPFILIRLWWRGRKAPLYRQRWKERFGIFTPPLINTNNAKVVWIHAVSVGETLAALPMIKALLTQNPSLFIVVTTTTPTGSKRVEDGLGQSVFHIYMPYDLPGSLSRFFKRLSPDLLIIMETELWPNLLAACERRQIPVVLANARLSEQSANGYRRFSALSTPMLKRLSLIAAQHEQDAQRFIELGVTAEKTRIIGNIKFDVPLMTDHSLRAREIKRLLGSQGKRLTWVAASTHQGEDEVVLNAFQQVKQIIPEVLLVLVPRHPERFIPVASLCDVMGFKHQRRSRNESVKPDTEILIGDTMGELFVILGAADLAFIGGSLVPAGGHNLIEPAIWGLPIITGPHLFNFAEVSQLLKAANALEIVEDADTLASVTTRLLQQPVSRQSMGSTAKAVVEGNRGALNRLLQCIQPYLIND